MVRSILVVDDDFALRECIAEGLSAHGHRVFTAVNGIDALEQLGQLKPEAKPCLILLDMTMPIMDGAEVLRRLIAENDAWRKHIVIISANADADDTAREAGVELLPKPFELAELLTVAGRHCGEPTDG